MAKPIECIIEVDEWGAKRLMESLLHPKKDPARDRFIERVRKMKFDVR
ncbi:MAG: hypothetical protein V1728_05100 [Candidatus Micrarchaeota archaeon]